MLGGVFVKFILCTFKNCNQFTTRKKQKLRCNFVPFQLLCHIDSQKKEYEKELDGWGINLEENEL